MKDPLVAPLAAIASGILLSRFVTFQQSELLLAIAAFLVLGVVALRRGSRVLAQPQLDIRRCGREDWVRRLRRTNAGDNSCDYLLDNVTLFTPE
ncbi:MAG: hypothetical protein WBQ65_04695 [Bryobacteraceae bacterium]